MKCAARMMAILATMLPLMAAAQLTSSDKLVAQVPFEFRAGNKVMPPGQCVVQLAGVDATTLVVRNRDAKAALISNASMGETKKAAGTAALVFHKYGDQYFLSGLKIGGSRTIYQLPEGKAEAEIRAQNVPATEEILLAALQ